MTTARQHINTIHSFSSVQRPLRYAAEPAWAWPACRCETNGTSTQCRFGTNGTQHVYRTFIEWGLTTHRPVTTEDSLSLMTTHFQLTTPEVRLRVMSYVESWLLFHLSLIQCVSLKMHPYFTAISLKCKACVYATFIRRQSKMDRYNRNEARKNKP